MHNLYEDGKIIDNVCCGLDLILIRINTEQIYTTFITS